MTISISKEKSIQSNASNVLKVLIVGSILAVALPAIAYLWQTELTAIWNGNEVIIASAVVGGTIAVVASVYLTRSFLLKKYWKLGKTAIEKNERESLLQAIAQNPTLLSKEVNHKTLLMIAAEQGKNNMVEELIRLGARLNDRNSRQETALSLAIQANHRSTALILLRHHSMRADKKELWSYYNCSLKRLPIMGDVILEIFKKMIALPNFKISELTNDEIFYILRYLAIPRNHPRNQLSPFISSLIPNDHTLEIDKLIDLAVFEKNIDLVTTLLSRKKVEEMAHTPLKDPLEIALMKAVHGNHINAIAYLLTFNPNIHCIGYQNFSPLTLAKHKGYQQIVDLLEPDTTPPLIKKVKAGQVSDVQLLLKDSHVDVNAIDKDGKNALYYAVEMQDTQSIISLLERKAWISPELLAMTQRGDLIHDLLDQAYNHQKMQINSRPLLTNMSSTLTSSRRVLSSSGTSSPQSWITYVQAGNISELIAAIATPSFNIDEKDAKGDNLLFWAVRFHQMDVLKAVLRRRPDLTIFHDTGESVLTLAATLGDQGIFRVLLEQRSSIDLNYHNRELYTALHIAINRQFDDHIIQHLLDVGANPNLSGKGNESPLTLAARNPNEVVIRSLLRKGANIHHKNHRGLNAYDIAKLFVNPHADLLNPASHAVPLRAGTSIPIVSTASVEERTATRDPDLIALIKAGDPKRIQDAISRATDPTVFLNEADDKGESPLMHAVRLGQVETILLLLEKKVRLDHKNTAGHTVLSSSFAQQNSLISEILASAHLQRVREENEAASAATARQLSALGTPSSVHAPSPATRQVSSTATRPTSSRVTTTSTLSSAIQNSDETQVNALLDAGGDVNLCTSGEPPIVTALRTSHKGIICSILRKHPNYAPNAFELAFGMGDPEITRLFSDIVKRHHQSYTQTKHGELLPQEMNFSPSEKAMLQEYELTEIIWEYDAIPAPAFPTSAQKVALPNRLEILWNSFAKNNYDSTKSLIEKEFQRQQEAAAQNSSELMKATAKYQNQLATLSARRNEITTSITKAKEQATLLCSARTYRDKYGRSISNAAWQERATAMLFALINYVDTLPNPSDERVAISEDLLEAMINCTNGASAEFDKLYREHIVKSYVGSRSATEQFVIRCLSERRQFYRDLVIGKHCGNEHGRASQTYFTRILNPMVFHLPEELLGSQDNNYSAYALKDYEELLYEEFLRSYNIYTIVDCLCKTTAFGEWVDGPYRRKIAQELAVQAKELRTDADAMAPFLEQASERMWNSDMSNMNIETQIAFLEHLGVLRKKRTSTTSVTTATSSSSSSSISSPVNAMTSSPSMSLIDAIKAGDFGKVRACITRGEPLNVKDTNGDTALICAMRATPYNPTLIEFLLSRVGIDVVNAQGEGGDTALIIAARLGYGSMVADLVRKPGINLSIRNTAGHTALDVASVTRNREIISLVTPSEPRT